MVRSSLKRKEIIIGECMKFQKGKKMSKSKGTYNRQFSFLSFISHI